MFYAEIVKSISFSAVTIMVGGNTSGPLHRAGTLFLWVMETPISRHNVRDILCDGDLSAWYVHVVKVIYVGGDMDSGIARYLD